MKDKSKRLTVWRTSKNGKQYLGYPKKEKYCIICKERLPLGKSKYCSEACSRQALKSTYIKKGYRPGNPLNKMSRLNVPKRLELDGQRCAKCGSTNNLDIHHIDGTGWHKEESNNNIDNLITLCHQCHMRLHLGKNQNVDINQIVKLYIKGWTLQAIGKKYGLSRQRIHQILKHYGLSGKKLLEYMLFTPSGY